MEAPPPPGTSPGLILRRRVGLGRPAASSELERRGAACRAGVPVFCRAAVATAQPHGEDDPGSLPSGGAQLRADGGVAPTADRHRAYAFAPRAQEASRSHPAATDNGKGNRMAEDKVNSSLDSRIVLAL